MCPMYICSLTFVMNCLSVSVYSDFRCEEWIRNMRRDKVVPDAVYEIYRKYPL